ncbi:MAG: PAS domain S-box protein [Promethearchaeota archaeon]
MEEKYKKIFENVSDIIFLLDLEGNIIDINKTASDILGFTKDELIKNKNYKSFIDKKIIQDNISQTIEKDFYVFEYDLKKKDETLAPVEISMKLFDLANERIILGVARNIKKRKKIEKALKDKISEQELLLDNLDFQIWYLVEPESYVAVNKARAEFLGFKKKDLVSRNIYEFQSKKEADACFNGNERAFLEKCQIRTEEWLKNAKGEYRLCRVIRTPKLDENGNVEYLICTSEDITELKKAEEEMKSRIKKTEILNKIIIAGNEAKDVNNLLKIILASTLELLKFEGGGIYLLDNNNGYAKVVCNIGLPEDFVENVKSVKIDESPYNMIFLQGKAIFTADYHKIHPERSKKWGLLSLASVPIIAEEQIIGALNIASMSRYSFSEEERDLLQFVGREMGNILSKLKAEEKLKESEERYRQAYNRVDFYKNIFAHDINNILQNIKMGIDLNLKKLNSNNDIEVIRKLNLMIKEQVNRAEKLVSNIRKLSQMEEEVEIKLKKINLINVLENSIKYIKKGFKFKETNIILNANFKNLYINGNELLQDVFENILINSINYTEKDIVNIEINILKQKKKKLNYIRMEFIDNGIGIQDSLKKRIFEGGFNKHPSVKGMGLGLSLVKKVIQTYNGTIWVEDKIIGDYSKGSKFIILIPEVK